MDMDQPSVILPQGVAAWFPVELFNDIFQRINKSDLACVARTSRHFQCMADRVLWSELHSSDPLM